MVKESDFLRYLRHGFSVIPIKPGTKEPLVRWQDYQQRRPTEEEITEWVGLWPDAGIALVTGAISGVVVVDVDTEQAEPEFEEIGPVVETGRGRHYYFAHPGGTVPNRVRCKPGIDVRGDGGYVLMPPTLHPSGKHYEWLRGLEEELPPLPQWAREKPAPEGELPPWKEALGDVPLGEQDNHLTALAGKLARHLPEELWVMIPAALAERARHWAQDPARPWTQQDFLRIASSVAKRERERRGPTITMPDPISLKQLIETDMPEPRFIVENLFPEGLTILAGKPKKGKSLLWMQAGTAVALGRPMWEPMALTMEDLVRNLTFNTVEGDVLYISIEDPLRRVRSRALRQLAARTPRPERFFVIDRSLRIDQGLVDWLDNWMALHPQTRLIAIDPFIRIRPPEKQKGDMYARDYEDVVPLKLFADRHNVSVTLIHHFRKASADDSIDLVTGTLGVVGAADNVIGLHRTGQQPEATLETNPKDCQEIELAIRLGEDLVWQLLGHPQKIKEREHYAALIEYLKQQPGGTCKQSEVQENTKIPKGSLSKIINLAVQRGAIENLGRNGIRLVGGE